MPSADLFCTVVDNYGDAGIAWRLARAMAADHGFSVRLVIDRPETLAAMVPALNADASFPQTIFGITIQTTAPDDPADLVVEVLTATAPESYLTLAAARAHPPVWIVYEHVTFEPWAAECHLKPSPHPRLPLTRYFFYPGACAGQGGMLDPYTTLTPVIPEDAKRLSGIHSATFGYLDNGSPLLRGRQNKGIRVLLFGYENAGVSGLVSALSSDGQKSHVDIPSGRIWPDVAVALGTPFTLGTSQIRGNATFCARPFIPQDDFIAALPTYDLVFIRGEDSMTAALVAGVPLIWQIYVQDDCAHLAKLEAFLDFYTEKMGKAATTAVRGVTHAWNASDSVAVKDNMTIYRTLLPEITHAAQRIAEKIKKSPDTVQNIVDFWRKLR